jgi:hypothetical protein
MRRMFKVLDNCNLNDEAAKVIELAEFPKIGEVSSYELVPECETPAFKTGFPGIVMESDTLRDFN